LKGKKKGESGVWDARETKRGPFAARGEKNLLLAKKSGGGGKEDCQGGVVREMTGKEKERESYAAVRKRALLDFRGEGAR